MTMSADKPSVLQLRVSLCVLFRTEWPAQNKSRVLYDAQFHPNLGLMAKTSPTPYSFSVNGDEVV